MTLSSINDVIDVMDFDSLILFSGIGGRELTESDFQKAMEAARRLEEDNVFKFDYTDETAFLRSVVKFANSFRK